jgi:hypothetical protein
LLNKIAINNLIFLILSLSAFGYPISVGFGLLFNFPTQPINFIFRLIILFLSLICLTFQFKKRIRKPLINNSSILFLVFWFIYSIRLFYDLFIAKVPYGKGMGSEIVILMFTYGSCLLPTIAIMLFDFKKDFDIKLFFNFSFISNIFIFLVLLKEYGFGIEIFLVRATIINDDGVSPLNSITISLAGSILIILSIILWQLDYNKNNIKYKFFLSFLIILGLFNLLAGASRSPIGITILVLIIVFYKFWILRNRSSIYFLKISGYLLALLLSVTLFLAPVFKTVDLVFINRVLFTLDRDKIKEDRDFSIESAWNDFLDSPVYGKRFVGTYDGFYPHSILVEVPMSTGILGSFFFFSYITSILLSSFKMMNNGIKYIFVSSIFISFFVISITSGSIFFSYEFWVWSMFINKIKF